VAKLRTSIYMKHLFILSIFILGSACSHPTVDKEAPAVNELSTGQKFRIILPENHDEGHLWKLEGKHEKVVDNWELFGTAMIKAFISGL
jgi:hypothetical protein